MTIRILFMFRGGAGDWNAIACFGGRSWQEQAGGSGGDS